jgi:Ca2+-binding RTX toxin-like protein
MAETGIDTLFLMQGGSFDLTQISLSGIERIEGSLEKDFITISGSQLASVTTIDGLDEFDAGTVADTSNILNITGTGIDLRNKTIANFSSISLRTDGAVVTLDDKGLADLISGSLTTGDRIDLVGGQVFTADEKGALFRHGIETVSDASGTYTNKAPELQGFGGDRSVGWAGQRIFLDAGQNATLKEDDRLLSALDVSVTGGSASDHLEIATTGRVRLQSSDTSLRVLVDGVDIGFVANPSAGPSLAVHFNQHSTPERVQELVRALTYKDATGLVAGTREIKLTLTDYTFHSSTAAVTVEQQRNQGPDAVTLSHAVVKELASNNTVVGTLSATDPNPGDSVSFTLVNDAGGRFALDGSRLVVRQGAKLDYEQAKSHQVTVRATDKLGLFKDSTFTIMVQDVAKEVAMGTDGNDIFVGGRGQDRFYGKLGNDVLKGGRGKDTFVFDTKLGPSNTDTIRDFSVKDDKIWLAKSVFRKAGAKGGLSSDAFWKGAKAHDSDDRIIYNQKTGILSYDADGSGSGKAVEIAVLTKQLKLTHASFFIV